jgi:hypothetical protein
MKNILKMSIQQYLLSMILIGTPITFASQDCQYNCGAGSIICGQNCLSLSPGPDSIQNDICVNYTCSPRYTKCADICNGDIPDDHTLSDVWVEGNPAFEPFFHLPNGSYSRDYLYFIKTWLANHPY